jgi:dolichol-phosphate mannosyltransferase
MRLSIVIPAFDARTSIARVVDEAYAVVPAAILGEVIVVDDGSSDGLGDAVRMLITPGHRRNLRYLRHDQCYGRATALRSGVLAARYPVIVTLASDGCNDPADVARLAERLAAPGAPGPALVCGWRTRRTAGGIERARSKGAKLLRWVLLADRSPDVDCGIRAFNRESYALLPYFGANDHFLPVLFQAHGHGVVHVPVNDRPPFGARVASSRGGRPSRYLRDLAGVAWLQARTSNPVIIEQWPDGGLDAGASPVATPVRPLPSRTITTG